MRQSDTAREQAIEQIALRRGFSAEATATMLQALARGNGRMAQFEHAEFGGAGQWMAGGMTMIGDMFDARLKDRVNALCLDLADLLKRSPQVDATEFRLGPRATAAQQDGAAGDESAAPRGSNARYWWGEDLGVPDTTGGQNEMRYAYFSGASRLAVDMGGKVTVYDTLDHRISGVSQRQGGGYSLQFASQHGDVSLADLPVVKGSDAC